MTPEERFERIEKTLDRMAASHIEHEAWQKRFEANLESLQNFMDGAFERSEKRLDRIEAALLRIAEHFDRHTSDGHGGD